MSLIKPVYNLTTDSAPTPLPELAAQPTLPSTLELPPRLEEDLRKRYELTCNEFKDNGGKHVDPHEYSRLGDDQGLVIIFNQEIFDTDLPTRKGTAKDEAKLKETFLKLGFNVKMQTIHRDEGRRQIIKICEMYQEYVEKNAIKSNALIVVFMSHGDKENILYTRDGQIDIMDLIRPLSSPFENKPKMFIFQACKSTEEEMIKHKEPQLVFPVYNLPADTIIYYSVVEGNVSIRDANEGTWLISELCKNLLMYGRREDVVSLLQRTTKCISLLQTNLTQNTFYKQMPVIVSTLQKKFYLSSNKYRENMHHSNKKIRDAANSLRTLVQQLN